MADELALGHFEAAATAGFEAIVMYFGVGYVLHFEFEAFEISFYKAVAYGVFKGTCFLKYGFGVRCFLWFSVLPGATVPGLVIEAFVEVLLGGFGKGLWEV